jgi:hypothetical protein
MKTRVGSFDRKGRAVEISGGWRGSWNLGGIPSVGSTVALNGSVSVRSCVLMNVGKLGG